VVSSLAYPNLFGTKRLGCCCCGGVSIVQCIFFCSGHVETAIVSYKQALQLRPDFPEATCNLLHTLQVMLHAFMKYDDSTQGCKADINPKRAWY
jgi:hypothetical protein